jgi:L-cysteine desulfidase
MTARESEIIGLIRKEVKPALGCTEPIAVALAVAKSMEIIEEQMGLESSDWRSGNDFNLSIEVSGNILKNGMGVGIPGTGMVGLHIAAALGAVCGKSSYGLEVLSDLSDSATEQAKAMVESSAVSIGLAETELKLYVKANVETSDGHKAFTVIQNDHDNIVETGFDGVTLSSAAESQDEAVVEQKSTLDYNLTVKEILEFASNVAYEDIEFILESRTLNLALAYEGMKGAYGLKVGYAISLDANREVFGGDFLSYAMAMTAAASDARMAGCTLAAMSNSGSGNQGLTSTVPVVVYAEQTGASHEQMVRSLILSHLTVIYIKQSLGRLSALCGCVVAATGSSCGITYLMGGGYDEVTKAVKNMIGNLAGMICDGAKPSCAMKCASGVSTAVVSALMAMNGRVIKSVEGIIDDDVDRSIRNLTDIGRDGMTQTDAMILKIMTSKS